MSYPSTYFIYVILACVLTTTPLFAQQQSEVTSADINYIRKSNAWLGAKNAAGLVNYTTVNISNAELYFNKEDGGFRNYYQSDDSRQYGLKADSYTRLNQKVVLSGAFEYQNFKGNNMTGSAFLDPYKSPFDIVEMDAANKGTKESELYQLNGAIGAQLTSKLSIGGKLNYGTANYAKTRDLRHTNKLLMMDLTGGLLYQLSDAVELGASYNYGRRIESLSFKTFGNKSEQYLSLISYGSFYGRKELFGPNGFTSSDNTNPLKDIRQGASLQLNLNINDHTKLFNEFSYEDRNGFFGEDGSTSILYTRHTGTGFSYQGQLSIVGNEVEHHFGLKGTYDFLRNKETIYRRETNIGGVNSIVIYGDREVFSGENIHAGLNYDVFLAVKNNRPTWAINFSADYFSSDRSVTFYPFIRDQKIHQYLVSGQINRQYLKQKNAFNIGLGIGYGKGNRGIVIDDEVVPPASTHVPPSTMSQFSLEEIEYFTASRLNGNVELQYTRSLQNNLSAYAKLNYAHIYAGKADYLGKHFNRMNLSLGFNF